MKILIVATYNKRCFSPFIVEQAESLGKQGCEVAYFGIVGKGVIGYLKNRKALLYKIAEFQPDIIHAHYGLSGLLANLQRKIPVITTYHGSDINNDKVFRLSRLCMRLSKFNIFVSQKNIDKSRIRKRYALLPCGVDIEIFHPIKKMQTREELHFKMDEKLVLFAGAFDNQVKNAKLAIQAVNLLDNVRLIELKGYSRQQVASLMNAVDAVLMTSFTEGSPQFIKEAMACNCPIVSVDVGDVKNVLGSIKGCYVAQWTPEDIAKELQQALILEERTNGRERILELGLDLETIAKRITSIYQKILNKSI